MDPKDFYIWVGICASCTAAFALVVSFYSIVIYDQVGIVEENIGQMNVDLLRGKDVIQEWLYKNNN